MSRKRHGAFCAGCTKREGLLRTGCFVQTIPPDWREAAWGAAPRRREPRRVAADNAHAGVPPVAISHDNLLQIVTAPPVPGIGGMPPLSMRTIAFCDSFFPDPPGIVTLQKASVYTSLREGGGLGRSPKTEEAIGSIASWIARDGTSPKLSHFLYPLEATTW